VDAKGATIDLGDGIEGYVMARDISDDRVDDASQVLKVGEEVEAKFVGMDRKGRTPAAVDQGQGRSRNRRSDGRVQQGRFRRRQRHHQAGCAAARTAEQGRVIPSACGQPRWPGDAPGHRAHADGRMITAT
jgi:predicted RNA-binding protein with RPS1 domain